ncbi:MAG: universal stress protein [Rudaea sp.]|nr:universal stress protein [Rudaea sp.]
MFNHILLPTDGSRLSEKSVKQGIRMAKAMNANVTALHVLPTSRENSYQIDILESEPDRYSASAECALEYLSFVGRVARAAGVECDLVHVTSDQPFKAIIKTAQNKKCDLILMASHGRRGIEGFLLGSETQKVLTHSQIPVLVYR